MSIVYRIVLKKWADKLVASGSAARWNSDGKFVLYTASTRSLACLENVVHRSAEGLSMAFKTLLIELPKSAKIQEIEINSLPSDWYSFSNYHLCQSIGDEWYDARQSLVLSVPSAIIKEEKNYIINTQHPDFVKVKLVGVEDFLFDTRIKNS